MMRWTKYKLFYCNLKLKKMNNVPYQQMTAGDIYGNL